MSKRSSRSNHDSIKEQKTQSGSKRGNSNRSKKSSRRSHVAPTQHSQKSIKTQNTQKSIAPPDEDKYDQLKKEALKTRETQRTQLTEAKSMIKRENGFDKTQWELTKWAEEHVKPTDIAAAAVGSPCGLAPPVEVKPEEVPGENRQEAGEKGDYLLDIPITSLILNGIETLFASIALILCAIGHSEAKGMGILAIIYLNLIACLAGVIFIAVWQFLHKDVATEESKQGTKYYFVRGCSKKMYFHLHYWRTILYFLTFVIILYYGTCGDEHAGFSKEGFCRKGDGAAGRLFISSASFSIFSVIPSLIHLVYVKKGIFAIVSFCRKN